MASRIYVRTHSLVLGSGDVSLVWCASSTLGDAQFRVVPVTATLAGLGPALVNGTISVTTQLPPWSGEETGYGWTELSTMLPDSGGAGDTPAGVYALQLGEGDLSNPANVEATAYFVLRRRTSTTKMVVCYPFSTLAAYAGAGEGTHQNTYNSYNSGRTRRVSLDRPFDVFAYGSSKVDHTLEMALRVEAFARTLFGAPTDVDVCTSFDLDGDPDVLAGEAMHLFVSAGHDEYWSKAMRDKVAAFVEAGNNAAFFSANTFWWQVRFENDGRTMVCFKAGIEDPLAGLDDPNVTGNPAASPVNAEENLLTGVSYRRGTQWDAPSSRLLKNGSPWRLRESSRFHGVVAAALTSIREASIRPRFTPLHPAGASRAMRTRL